MSSPVTAAPAPPPQPVQNLLDFDDDDVTPVNVPAPAPTPVTTRQDLAMNKALPKPIGLDGSYPLVLLSRGAEQEVIQMMISTISKPRLKS